MPDKTTRRIVLRSGDCRKVLLTLPDCSIDSVVTDPPYGLIFMGKSWDKAGIAFDPAFWAQVLRVLKPGGHLLAMGGTRTYHRLVCAIEDAGFEIRDCVMWVYGSGFPKSHNIGDGWGTALKPAFEPVVLARKAFSEKTVAANVLRWGTGAINIDGCRVGTETISTHSRGTNGAFPKRPTETTAEESGRKTDQRSGLDYSDRTGRWPANLIHDGSEGVIAAFPNAPGQMAVVTGLEPSSKTNNVYGQFQGRAVTPKRSDSGSAARFFYSAKASKKDRAGSKHPTVKPIALMQYLIRLITPPGGVVLDPFAGTGTTGVAALREGMRAMLIEREAEYRADIHNRLHQYRLDAG